MNSVKVFLELPVLVLENIFLHLDDASLAKLSTVNQKLWLLLRNSVVWKRKLRNLKWSWSANDSFRYLPIERYRTAKLWVKNNADISTIATLRPNSIPCIRLDYKCRLLTKRDFIEARVGIHDRPVGKFISNSHSDLSRFSQSNNSLISGNRNGDLFVWNYRPKYIPKVTRPCVARFNAHSSDIHMVDGDRRLLISGSKDCNAKLWTIDQRNNLVFKHRWCINERIWSVQLNHDYSFAALGSSGCVPWFENKRVSLSVWDIESGSLISPLGMDCQKGAGIMDMKFETNDCLLTVGYDCVLRYWDIRTNRCEWYWEEPYNSSFYSIASDRSNMVLVGTARHSRVWILDKRYNKAVKTLYFDHSSRPVYSLGFNTKSVYGCVDMALRKLTVT